jgi:cytochrome c peroxidase
MRIRGWTAIIAGLALAAALSAQRYGGGGRTWWSSGQGGFLGWDETFDNPDGQVGVVNKKGALRTDGHPFFESLGSNGRACITCHQPANAMSVSAASLRERWQQTRGKDPVFAAVDGSNCPDLPQAEEVSHSLLLERGLFRIELAWPPAGIQPEFRIEVVRDPTGCNKRSDAISVYRRPRIAANLDYVVAGRQGFHFMADGREPSLQSQAATAIRVHEQAASRPSPEQLQLIVDFESQIYTAQFADVRGGLLGEKGGPSMLGPDNLAAGKLNGVEYGAPFDSFWRKPQPAGVQAEFRASVARGSDVFFSRRLNESYTCGSCHSTSATQVAAIVTNTSERGGLPGLPLFRATCDSGRIVYTQDPGRALITGRCSDIGLIVRQQLRGLAARAPYFSNGRAMTLREVVDIYDRGLGVGFSEQEKQDLVNFLRVL